MNVVRPTRTTIVKKDPGIAPTDNLGEFEIVVAAVDDGNYEPAIINWVRQYRKYTDGVTPEQRDAYDARLRAYVERYRAWLREGGKA